MVCGRVARWLIHDLRNPTQALALITELMGEDPAADEPGVADTVREATVHVTRTLGLLDRLLRMPPPDARPRPLSVKDHLDFVVALFRTHRSSVGLEVDAVSAGTLPPVRGIEHELDQILLTLVLAALDALHEQQGTIVVRATPDAEGVLITATWESLTVTAPTGGTAAHSGLEVATTLAERNGGGLTETRVDRQAGFRLRLRRWTGRSA